jgi:hypothetical protein
MRSVEALETSSENAEVLLERNGRAISASTSTQSSDGSFICYTARCIEAGLGTPCGVGIGRNERRALADWAEDIHYSSDTVVLLDGAFSPKISSRPTSSPLAAVSGAWISRVNSSLLKDDAHLRASYSVVVTAWAESMDDL